MTSEMYIENYRLDISSDISSLLTFELDNIRNFASRSTTWSKTIVLPGTANNNKLFGHIFQIGQANAYNSAIDNVGVNFNAAKSASCIIFQDQMQTFKGVIRLLQINITNGKPEYEVAVFGQLAGLNVALSAGFLTDLDFSAYDHTYNVANITASWDATPGSGYYYPLIDYGQASVLKHDWDIRTFRPAMYVREYIDKIITAAGFRFSSALIDTDRFKRLVVPHNQKNVASSADKYLEVNVVGQSPTASGEKINFPTVIENNGFSITGNNTYNWDNPITVNPNIILTLAGIYFTDEVECRVGVYRQRGADPAELLKSIIIPSGGGFSISFTVSGEIQQNDDIYCAVFGPLFSSNILSIISGKLLIEPIAGTIIPASPGDTIIIANTIPVNIRQIDFLVSIIKLFNLYVYEDRLDTRLIHITPYIDFYSTSHEDAVDWTYKLNRDKAIKIKPMSELNAKIYNFKYKADGDYYNDLYRKRYGQGYGDYIFDSEFEFAEQENSFELIFSSTPLVGYSGEEKILPTIFKLSNNIEERIDSNIRILQTKKVSGVSSWDIKDGATVLTSITNYGYAGHLDDPDVPSNDLNFGALRELFFVLISGNLSNTQFNLYWSSYMAEITDKDSKLMSAWFYLRPSDILNLDFSKKVYIDGVLFRLNSIKDYNITMPQDCEAELLKVNYLEY
jgi:hypothetical protein